MKASFKHTVYKSQSKLSEPIIKLLNKANSQLKASYAPYSMFNVGAAILLENGAIIGGANQENVSYPLCICAERVALYTYGAKNSKHLIKALAVTAKYDQKPLTAPCMPCGACRQVIQEYEQRQGSPIDIYVTASGIAEVIKIAGITHILPSAFHQDHLL